MKKSILIILAALVLSACKAGTEQIPETETSGAPVSSATETQAPLPIANIIETTPETESDTSDDIREINVIARRFEFSPSVIRVKQGEKVRINITNVDTLHNIYIPDLNEFSNSDTFILDTSQKGEFAFFCAVYCGFAHAEMNGKIIIE